MGRVVGNINSNNGGGSKPTSGFVLPRITSGGVNLVNPQAEGQLQRQSEQIKTQEQLRKESQERLPSSSADRIAQAASIYRLASGIRDDINNGRNVLAAGILDRDFKAKIELLRQNVGVLKSGLTTTDKQDLKIARIIPNWQDVILGALDPKGPKAVMINKLGQLAAEARAHGITVGGGTSGGGLTRFNESLQIVEDTLKEFEPNDGNNRLQKIDDAILDIQDRLKELKGGRAK